MDTVETVLGVGNLPPPSSSFQSEGKRKPQTRSAFVLPEAATFPTNVVAYLQRRGISPEIINRCIEAGILFENLQYKNVRCVGKDEQDKNNPFSCSE